jgi:hypothetical protein
VRGSIERCSSRGEAMHTYRRFPWARTSILVAHRKLRLNKHSMDKTAEKRKTMVVITCIAVDSVVWNKARSVPSLSAGHFSASQLDNFGGAHWAAEYITGYRMRFIWDPSIALFTAVHSHSVIWHAYVSCGLYEASCVVFWFQSWRTAWTIPLNYCFLFLS